MCKDCGSCSKEHSKTIDDAVDNVLDLPFFRGHIWER
jgi:hypothetical protein